jgi:hypothetical protein
MACALCANLEMGSMTMGIPQFRQEHRQLMPRMTLAWLTWYPEMNMPGGQTSMKAESLPAAGSWIVIILTEETQPPSE